MASYSTIDYLPDLNQSAIDKAQILYFSPYTSSNELVGWDNWASYYTTASYAILNSTFKWTAVAGATYDISSTSFFDPFLIQIYDNLGNVVAVDTERASDGYGRDYIWNFVAPYSGTFYVSAGWHQGEASSNKFVMLAIYEDVDTAAPLTPVDKTPPSTIIFNPVDEASDVSINSNIAITFNEPIQRGTGNIVIKTADGAVVYTYDAKSSANLSISGNSLTINPSADFAYGTSYKVEFEFGSIKDVSGNNFAGTVNYNFRTVTNPGTGQILTGTAATDNLTGGPGTDSLFGLGGNDRIKGNAGDDNIDGGAGLDIAIYSGSRNSHVIDRRGDSTTVSGGTDGMDYLLNVERLEFDDVGLAFDFNGNAGQAYRIYQAAFNRTPDIGGLSFWIHSMDSGVSLRDVAKGFIASAEFQSEYGTNPTNYQLTTLLYNNVLHRNPDQGGYDYWTGQLNNGLAREDALAFFAESPENQAALIGVIQDGITYIPI